MSKISILVLCFLFYLAALAMPHSANNKNGSTQDIAPSAVTIQLQPVLTTGLSSPLFMTNAHDGSNRLFIVEQPGTIKVLVPGQTTPTNFLDIQTRVLSGGEQGLLGLAFHPQYPTNGRFFVDYTRQTDGATVIAEYHVSQSDPNLADTTEITLLTIPQPFTNHNGGMVVFGPDGFLYIGMGDGGSANDPGNRAQNINNLLGKILRIDVDHANGAVPYSSPSGNPFFGATPGADEIFAVGMRNPFRFSFDRSTGQLYVGDVGQGAWEEVDIVTVGKNYGWRVYEGNHCTGNDPMLCTTPPPSAYTFPILEYAHAGGRCSITGGYVYRGPIQTLPTGSYVFGDFCTGEILMFDGTNQTVLMDTTLSISSFGEDEAGEIYVVGLGGTVHRLVNPNATCSFNLSPGSKMLPPTATNANVMVTAPVNCNWNAVSNDSWITISGGSSGAGTNPVLYSVMQNVSSLPRTGSMTIAGMTYTITQAGIPAVALSGFKTDFDGDGKTELGFYRAGTWGILKSMQSYSFASGQFFGWGGNGLQPIVADFDGDGRADIAYIVPPASGQSAAYSILKSSANYSFGQALFFPAGFPSLGDTPVPADFDGDLKADPAIWRASTGVWIIPQSSTGYSSVLFAQWGQFGDVPIVGDIDGDGRADIGFYRNGVWGFLKSSQSFSLSSAQFFSWGGTGLQPIVADFDGDGKADLAYVAPPAGGQSAAFAILKSSTGFSFAQAQFIPAGWPSLGDTPVVGDYDGDGKADPGIWRASAGVWIIPLSSTNYSSHIFSQWGQQGDVSFPNSTGKR